MDASAPLMPWRARIGGSGARCWGKPRAYTARRCGSRAVKVGPSRVETARLGKLWVHQSQPVLVIDGIT